MTLKIVFLQLHTFATVKIAAYCIHVNKISGQGVQCRMVLVVKFLVFLKLLFFALLVIYVTWCNDVKAIFHLP